MESVLFIYVFFWALVWPCQLFVRLWYRVFDVLDLSLVSKRFGFWPHITHSVNFQRNIAFVGLSDYRTIALSDYRTVGLSHCRTIGLSDYRSDPWYLVNNKLYWLIFMNVRQCTYHVCWLLYTCICYRDATVNSNSAKLTNQYLIVNSR